MEPSRKAIFALRTLERALGWEDYPRTAKLATAADFAERAKCARDSAGLADLLCGPAQARAIRAAVRELKRAQEASAKLPPLRDSRGRIMATDHADETCAHCAEPVKRSETGTVQGADGTSYCAKAPNSNPFHNPRPEGSAPAPYPATYSDKQARERAD